MPRYTDEATKRSEAVVINEPSSSNQKRSTPSQQPFTKSPHRWFELVFHFEDVQQVELSFRKPV